MNPEEDTPYRAPQAELRLAEVGSAGGRATHALFVSVTLLLLLLLLLAIERTPDAFLR